MARDWIATIICTLMIAALPARDAWAGAWTQEKGDTLVILKAVGDRAQDAFDETGARTIPRNFEKYAGEIYVEYGLLPWLTVVAKPIIESVRDDANASLERETGLAASEIGARVRLAEGPWGVVSVQPLAIVPGTLPQSTNVARTTGETDYELRLLHGRSFALWGVTGFTDISGAWRARGGPQADQWRADATVGLDLSARWQLLAKSNSVWGGDFSVHKLSLSAVYDVTRWLSIETGAERALAGRNVIAEDAVFLALWIKF